MRSISRLQRQTEPNAHIGQFAFEPTVFLSQTKSFKMLGVRLPRQFANDLTFGSDNELFHRGRFLGFGR